MKSYCSNIKSIENLNCVYRAIYHQLSMSITFLSLVRLTSFYMAHIVNSQEYTYQNSQYSDNVILKNINTPFIITFIV